MTFSPTMNLDALSPLVERLEERRRQIAALEVAPELHQSLRSAVEARAAHLSTLIEGNTMTEAQVTTLFVEGRAAPSREEGENLDYRDAARCAAQLAGDFSADIDGGLIRTLHYIVVRTTDRYGTAGQYRTTQNTVGARGRPPVYVPPPYGDVPRLMADLVAWLREQRGTLHPLILAAVAHAEFEKVHPFDDGNGRTGRALTRYLMLRGNWGLRGYVSAEEIFGSDIPAYYATLNALGAIYPLTSPDLTKWVAWFLTRLRDRCNLRIAMIEAYSEVLERYFQAASSTGPLPIRIKRAMGIAYLRRSVGATEYAKDAGISHPTAVSDLNRLVDRGVLVRVGAGRAARYEPVDSGFGDVSS